METSEHYFLLEDVLFHKKKKKKACTDEEFKKKLSLSISLSRKLRGNHSYCESIDFAVVWLILRPLC